jgi:hypothetical protein
MEVTLNKETLKRIDDLRKLVMSKGIVKEEVVEQLVALRPLFIEQKEPLVTRVVRLTAEYIAEHGVFNLNLMAEEDEEGNIPDEELDLDADDSFNLMKENFLYLLDLFEHPDNQVNREELQRVKQMYLNRGMF